MYRYVGTGGIGHFNAVKTAVTVGTFIPLLSICDKKTIFKMHA